MAENEDQDRQLDEFGFPIPTQAEMEAERNKTDQVLALAGAASNLEQQLPSTLPTDVPAAPMRTEIAPPAPLNLPVSQGRMYLGPAMTPGQESEFMASPSQTSINLAPPPAGLAPSRLEQMQAADLPGTRTISIQPSTPTITSIDPGMRQFAAQQQIQSAIAKGMPIQDAIQLYGSEYFAGGRKPMTAFQQAQVARWNRPVPMTPYQQSQVARQQRLDQPKLKDDPQYRALNDRDKELRKQLDILDAIPVPENAEQKATYLNNKRRIQRERVALQQQRTEIEGRYASSATTPYIVGRQYGTMVYKGGDPNLESSWQKAS